MAKAAKAITAKQKRTGKEWLLAIDVPRLGVGMHADGAGLYLKIMRAPV